LSCFINIHFYTIFLYHVFFYHNMETIINTPTGFLIAVHPYVEHIQRFLGVECLNWGEDIEKIKHKFSSSYRTLVMHKAVIDSRNKNLPPFAKDGKKEDYILSNYPKLKSMHLVLSGHWHKRNIFKQDGTLFINPGTLTRRRAVEDEIETFPSVVLIKYKGGVVDYDLIPLTCAKPSEEVISEDHLEEDREKSILLDGVKNFIHSLKEMNVDYKTKFVMDLLEIITGPKIDKDIESIIRETLIDVLGKDYEDEFEIYARRITTGSNILGDKEGKLTRKISRKKILLKKIKG